MNETEKRSIPQAVDAEVAGEQTIAPQDSYVLPPEERRAYSITLFPLIGID
jgi:hypothetical protein